MNGNPMISPEPAALSTGMAVARKPTLQAMRSTTAAFPTGIVLVAAQVDGAPVGLLANSFTSVSLEPPLLSVAVARTSGTWPLLLRVERWGISILGAQQEATFRQLSRKAAERFQGVAWTAAEDGSVLLAGASATFTVSLEAEIAAGDHVIALLRVLDLHRTPDHAPLIFYGSQLHRLAAHGDANPDTPSTLRGLT